MSFRISKNFTTTDWENLGLINDTDAGWAKGILIIEDRFQTRFFNHLNLIEKDENSGFLVMAVSCLLIETLIQFYLGIPNTDKVYRKNQKGAFRDFFMNSDHFMNDFTDDISHEFHKQFRNGLLHQGQTKKKSQVKINRSVLVEFANPNDVRQGLIIDRKKFYARLNSEFQSYLNKLRDNEMNFMGTNLRLMAIRKMATLLDDTV